MAVSCVQLSYDDIVASSSSTSTAGVRKSGRLAEKERVLQQNTDYVPQKYSYTENWCEECQRARPTECSQHSLTTIPDKVVLPRAFASLPIPLMVSEIRVSNEGHAEDSNKARVIRKSIKSLTAGSSVCDPVSEVVADVLNVVGPPDYGADEITSGIFARKAIPTRTKFGPLVCRFINAEEESDRQQPFHLMLDKANGRVDRADITDENLCNWMMFVRPARSAEEQNLVAFQQENSIYYVTIKNIGPGQELKVWYAKHYAERLGISILEDKLESKTDVNSSRKDDIIPDNADWPCYECSDRFLTEALLQKHLVFHDRVPVSSQRLKSRKKGRSRIFERKRYDDDEKKECEVTVEACGGGDDDASYCLSTKRKKPVTRLSLSSKRKRPVESAKPSKDRSVSKDTKSQKWSCQYCDLIFNEASVLNIHTLVHAAENALLVENVDERMKCCKLGEGGCAHLGTEATCSTIGVRVAEDGRNDDVCGFVDSLSSSKQPESTNEHHLSLMSLTCPVCKQDFETKTALVLHSSQHGATRQSLVQLRPFKCQLCLKTFRTFEKLQQHLLCHGDESMKPHPCEVCSRRFMNSAALAVHMKTHGDRKYYACPLCPESFGQVQQLRQHAEERHLERTINSGDGEKNGDQVEDEEDGDGGEEMMENEVIGVGHHMVVKTGEVDAVPSDNSNVIRFTLNVLSGMTSVSNQEASVWQPNVFCSVDSSAVPMTTDTTFSTTNPAAVATVDGGYGIGSCLFVEEIATVSGTQVTSYSKALTGDVDLQQYLEPREIDGVETAFVRDFAETSAAVEDTGLSPVAAMELGTKKCSVGSIKNKSKIDGTYNCPECHRAFTEFSAVSRHVRISHSGRSFDCSDCGRSFPSRDKLRLHSLRHSNHREFVCETCGRQFKRKDKLKDHLRKQHDPAKEYLTTSQNISGQRKRNPDAAALTTVVSPHDFMKFHYKCQKCLLGFKRRGMLINHMAKKHPDVPLDSVPELKLPILTSKYNFFCQYCNKVFKSSSKRKFHILKHHPGFELPAPLRSRKGFSGGSLSDERAANGFWSFSLPSATFSTPSGHSSSEPHACSLCHRQYASRSKLVQHQRKKHPPVNGGLGTGLADKAENSSMVVQSNDIGNSEETNEAMTTSPFEVDCGQFFVGASVFFAPKVNGSLDFSPENNQSDGRNVLLLSSSSENLLVEGSNQLGYVKPLQTAGSKQQSELSYSAKQQQQTVIIDPDLFAQAMRELTKSYAAKNSASFTRYDVQHQDNLVHNNDDHQDSSGGHQLMDIVSLTVDVADFNSQQQDQTTEVQMLQAAMPASASPVTSQSFIVDWGIGSSLVHDSSNMDPYGKI